MILLQVRNDLAFADPNVRLAAHHAIDKAALVEGVLWRSCGAAVRRGDAGTPGYVKDFKFAYDVNKAKELLAKSGFSPDKPVKLKLAVTNGHFPSDYDIARAIVADVEEGRHRG